MENPINRFGYKTAKKRAKDLCAESGRVWCDALNDDIGFNNLGLKHLVRKRGILRPKREQKRRFALLPHAKRMLKDKNIPVVHEKNNNTQFWIFTEKKRGKKVTLIVRQVGNGKKHFFSIF